MPTEQSFITSEAKRAKQAQSVNMATVAAIILGGGEGTRLFPLTETRCKPALPFGGKYRMIDVPVSNAIHSGCRKIFILTQYLSGSLHQHILQAYPSNGLDTGGISLLAAEKKPSREKWFQGTADAVRQSLEYLAESHADYFLILSGDQLYRMDFKEMFRFAKETDADLVIATLPIGTDDAKRMGVMKTDQNGFITHFAEKPQDPAVLASMQVQEGDKPFLGSMGIYLFKREVLFYLLQTDPREDFGKHLIPTIIHNGNSAAYQHEGYWEDIGTIGSYHKANLDLTSHEALFKLYHESKPLYTYHPHLPAPQIENAQITRSMIGSGSFVQAHEITNSILGPRSLVGQGSIISNSYLLGNDFYTPPRYARHLPDNIGIGKNVRIENAIIDKDVWIEDNVSLINAQKRDHYDNHPVYIRDGIIVVARGASLPSGFSL